jgi:DNA polymerase-3 subunit epsilon
MSAQKWHEGTIAAFDTETTGINPAEDRIVTAAVVYLTPGQRPRPIRWVIDPQVDIPDEAAAVHGWTNQRLAETIGRPGGALRAMADSTGKTVTTTIPRDAALFEIAAHLGATIGRDQAVLVHNAAYDLTLLEHETIRHGIDPLSSRPKGIRGVVDPMVIEKAHDPYRKNCYRAPGCNTETKHHECGGCRGGKHRCGGCGVTDKTLTSLCTHYGIRHGGAHDAAADAIAAARLMRRLLEGWPQMAAWKLGTLHEHQVTWRRQQMDSLREWFDKNGVEHDGCDPGWPLHLQAATAKAGAA